MALLVEVGWGGLVQFPDTITWTDITQRVDTKQGIKIDRGASDEMTETQPGTASMTLDNDDGWLTPGNAASPYFPYVRTDTPIRVRKLVATKNLLTNPTFESGTTNWKLGSDVATSFAQSAVRAQQGTKSLLITWGGAFNINPTFEASAGSWTGNTASVARVSTQAHSGSWSLQVTPNGSGATPRAESEKIPVTAGNTYRATGWLRCVSARSVGVNMNWYDASSVYMSTSFNNAAVPANTWMPYSQTFTAPPGAAFGQLTATVNGTPPVTDLLFADDMRMLGATGNEYPAVGTTVYGLTMGRQYTASAYVWVPTGSPAVQLFVDGLSAGAASTVFDGWTRITYTFTATSTSHLLELIPAGNPQNGKQVWLDSVQVEAGATATTFDPTPVRIYDRFWGVVNDWPLDWEGLEATVTITCTDIFKRINLLPALNSMAAEEVIEQGPVAFYPLTEPSDSTSAGDLSGAGAGSLAIQQAGVGGTLALGSAAAPAATGDQVATFTPVSATVGQWLSGDMGENARAILTQYWPVFEAWFQTTTGGRAIMGLASVDLVSQHVLSLSAGGQLQYEWTTSGGALTTVPVTGATGLADGNWHHVVYDQRDNYTYLDGNLVNTGVAVTYGYEQRILHIGGYRSTRLWAGQIGYVAMYGVNDPAGAILSEHYEAGTTGFDGEDADVRVQRLTRYAGLSNVVISGSTFDPIASQGSGGSQVMARLREVESTESGKLFARRDGYGLAFQSRDLRYNPTPAGESFQITYGDLEPGTSFKADDQKMVNSVTATRPGGATQKVTAPSAILAFGAKPKDLNILKTSDNSVLDAAYWLVSRYANPGPELREVVINAASLPAHEAILGADISSYFTVSDLLPQAPVLAARVTIEGYEETITEEEHLIQFHTSTTTNDSVWILDDPDYAVLDSTTRLAY
ncbi:carbohydrate binding domain-containing protein [Streptomyces sp. NPDC046984]|uniref:carbohydrate binding domain-containing protein n=1 Tax=Streptomyces sp. NPDC046984 TaxID=3155138 RepID=UPI0033C8B849